MSDLVDQPRDAFAAVPKPARRRAFTTAEIFTGLFVVLVVWFAGKIFLMTFGGLLLAVLLNTLARWLNDFSRLPYGWSLAVVVLTILALAVSVFWLVGSHLASQASEFTVAIPRGMKQIQDYLSDYQWGRWILEQSPQWGKAIAQGGVPSRITDLASSILDFFVTVVIMIFVGVYCAVEPELYTEGLLRLVPIDRRPRAKAVFTAVVHNLRWWLLGQMFAMVCVGIITGVGMWLVGAPVALTLGLLAAILEIIPNIGPVLWLVPAVLVAIPQGTRQVISVVAVYAVMHMIESYVLVPLVQRRTVWLPPALSIMAVVLLGLLAGFIGLLVAAPLALVAMLLIKMLYVEDRLGDHDIRVEGEPSVARK